MVAGMRGGHISIVAMVVVAIMSDLSNKGRYD